MLSASAVAGGVFSPGNGGCWGQAAAQTHHGAHHPANVHGVIAAGAVPVLVPQVFGVYVQHLEADGQDFILKLVGSREKRLGEVPTGALPPLSSLSGSL